MNISAIVLTYNEERHIADCLQSLSWASERIVIDSGSTDRTRAIAAACGARVIQHPFSNFSAQRNLASAQAGGSWILFIDADERVSDSLAQEIKQAVRQGNAAWRIPRHNYFFGSRLRFSGSQSDAPLRLFPKNSGEWKQPVHEFFDTSLPVRMLQHHLTHHTTRDLAHYMEKVNCYTPLEAETMLEKKRNVDFWDRWLRPPAKFIQLYFFKFGVLDGIPGLQFAALSAYYEWRRFAAYRALQKKKAVSA